MLARCAAGRGRRSRSGLSAKEVERGLSRYRPNELPTEPHPSLWMIARGQLTNPMNILLLIVGVKRFGMATSSAFTGPFGRELCVFGLRGCDHFEWSMVVAVVPVGVVQVTLDEIVDVVAVWYCFVSAARPVFVFGLVVGAVVFGCAVGRVDISDGNRVRLDAAGGVVMQCAVVQVVHVIGVADGRVPAGGAVLVFVCVAHMSSLRRRCASRGWCCSGAGLRPW